jgi:hypothetical protein
MAAHWPPDRLAFRLGLIRKAAQSLNLRDDSFNPLLGGDMTAWVCLFHRT